jgi:hypothetical protein
LAPAKIDAGALLGLVCPRLARLPGGAEAVAASPPGSGCGRARSCWTLAHVAHAFKEHRGELSALGVGLFCLPPYGPRLNRIERLWRSVRYEDMPVRAYATVEDLKTAVDAAMTRRAAGLQRSSPHLPKIA